MAPDERSGQRLYDRAVEVLGEEEAQELMAKLPPTAWPDLATKEDLLAFATKHELELMEQKLTAAFRGELTAETKTFITWTGTLMAIFTAVGVIANAVAASALR